jgi:chromosome segregation ATPase
MDEQGKDFRLEQFRIEYESAANRLEDLNEAKRETAARLAEHLEKLPTLPLAKIETWAAERRRLEDAMAALNELWNPAAEREREAESNWQQAQRNYGT